MRMRTSLGGRLIWVFGLWVACLLLPNREVSAEPKPRETWSAYVAGGQRYGSKHVTVSKTREGNFRYQVSSQVRIDMLGAQKQELTTKEEYIVTADYQPISIRQTRKGPTADVVVTGDVRDGVLQLQISRGEFNSTRSVKLSQGTILDVCLDDFLVDRSTPAGGAQLTFTLIDLNDWYTHASTAVQQASQGSEFIWSIDLGSELGQGTIKVDKENVHRETLIRLPPIHVVRCTEQEASQLTYRKLVGRDVLMFPLSKDIGRPERLKRLNIQLTWKDVPMSDLQLTDLRQKITEQGDQSGTQSVNLEIVATSPVNNPVALPIRGSQFEPYLAESRFIKPNDEAITRQAKQWAGDGDNSLESVRALSREVSEFLEGGSLIAETLSGPEVLQCKTGKCSEYSTLFASLARSFGVPTRIVLGERLVGGQWIGHMWNEAYVGKWITVDTTVDEVGTSFSLIKLTHSDTVLGTQRARFGLTESLNITVTDFEQSPASTTDAKTGISDQSYTNVDFACRITAAKKDWKLADKTQPGAAVIQIKVPDKSVLIHFIAFAVPANIGPETIGKGRQALSASQLIDFKMLKNEAFEVGDAKGQVAIFQGASKAAKDKITKTTEYIWTDGGAGFLLNLIAPLDRHEKHAADVETVLRSFERLTP